MRNLYQALIAALVVALIPEGLFGRSPQIPFADRAPQQAASASPAYCIAEHNVCKVVLAVDNSSHLGTGFSPTGTTDCFTGLQVHSCEYPQGSNTLYLWASALWIGAVVGNDTLVSTGADGWSVPGYEFHPEESPVGDMIYRSNLDPGYPEYYGAISHQDYIAVYYDTCNTCLGVSNDPRDGRPHAPLNIEVTQESHAWSYAYTEDFVLFDYTVRNTGAETLNNVYFGVYVDADVHHVATGTVGARDDLTGIHEPSSSAATPVAWIADNDGDLGGSYAVPGITGVCFLNTPSYEAEVSYNWWISSAAAANDFGPQTRNGFRDFGTGGTGTPLGDRDKYHVLRNGETDYDQAWTSQIDAMDTVWIYPPPAISPDLANGKDTRYLLSVGPTTIEPGAAKSYVTAYVAGDNFHTESGNGSNLPDNPWLWYDNVDFTDLDNNATWAAWIYDNPGVDTDGDWYAGEYYLSGDDTIWTTGDGVPDFRAACAPSTPPFWIEPLVGALKVRWNGHRCETATDPFSNDQDFEGYNIYLSTSGAPSSFALSATYDIEDFYKFRWSSASAWINDGHRFSMEELKCLYAPNGCNDTGWNPLNYDADHPYILPGFFDSLFYFDELALNASLFGVTTPILKSYPMAPEPPYADPADVPVDSVDFYLTDSGYFKFYEYELTITSLLPETPYWIAVSAFDCGSIMAGGGILESPVAEVAQVAYPLPGDPPCCIGDRGNVLVVPDCDRSDQTVDIVDLQLMIDHMFLTFVPLCCEEEVDIDVSGTVDITDLQVMVDHQFLSLAPLPSCP